MSIEKKRKGQYHQEISVTGYDEQHEQLIGSMSQRTNNVVQTEMPESIHKQVAPSRGSSPTVKQHFSANVSDCHVELSQDNMTTYQTNPQNYQLISQSQNPCTETGCSPHRQMLHCTSMLEQGEIEDEPEPREQSPLRTAQEPSPQRVTVLEQKTCERSSENSEVCMQEMMSPFH